MEPKMEQPKQYTPEEVKVENKLETESVRSPELPGDPLPGWRLFEEKVHMVDGKQRVVGFNVPDRKYYPLGENEELVHTKSADGHSRDTFIRKDGQDTPFEIWKESK